ncbi:uncharacterized protein FOMMEDRAFT_140916 [Fomitiporia mediterranea MF3/22]|uniref:uncharacterized protein n=1 Tax=Fomitiporia mediterranea (strain MF3/22) TaxID=694068 RepID=UPI00044072FB|nr:uncharacterized protein FOMMEDRAFT_140916 [Fomitiporia mediterranea MF3/22]EJD03215.1 hypothetical protein FOMMEDRAFT_140916 [Fomitiporia mediterranea MF3/22]
MSRGSRNRSRRQVDDEDEDVGVDAPQEIDGEYVYDPDQDRDEKRALRQDYRKLQDNELLLDPKAIKSEALTQMVQRADTLFSKVKGPQEATLDSSFLVTAATLGNAKARSMRAGAGGFEIDDLVARLFTFMGGHRPGEERITEDGENVDPDVEGDRPLDWSAVGRKAMAKSRRVPAQDFMLGLLTVEAKKRNIAKRTQREKADAVERRPQELKEDDIERSENETTKNVAALEGFLKKQPAPMNLFHLIINPESFGQSVENLFYLSFLIRDGKVSLEYSEDTNEPMIMLVEPPTDEDYKEGLTKKQLILELDITTWKRAIEVFEIRKSALPTRKAARTKLGDKWYG